MKNPTIFLVFLLSCAAARLHCAAARLHCAAARLHCAVARLHRAVAKKSVRNIVVFPMEIYLSDVKICDTKKISPGKNE